VVRDRHPTGVRARPGAVAQERRGRGDDGHGHQHGHVRNVDERLSEPELDSDHGLFGIERLGIERLGIGVPRHDQFWPRIVGHDGLGLGAQRHGELWFKLERAGDRHDEPVVAR
jgi:hypothetical protein